MQEGGRAREAAGRKARNEERAMKVLRPGMDRPGPMGHEQVVERDAPASSCRGGGPDLGRVGGPNRKEEEMRRCRGGGAKLANVSGEERTCSPCGLDEGVKYTDGWTSRDAPHENVRCFPWQRRPSWRGRSPLESDHHNVLCAKGARYSCTQGR